MWRECLYVYVFRYIGVDFANSLLIHRLNIILFISDGRKVINRTTDETIGKSHDVTDIKECTAKMHI